MAKKKLKLQSNKHKKLRTTQLVFNKKKLSNVLLVAWNFLPSKLWKIILQHYMKSHPQRCVFTFFRLVYLFLFEQVSIIMPRVCSSSILNIKSYLVFCRLQLLFPSALVKNKSVSFFLPKYFGRRPDKN